MLLNSHKKLKVAAVFVLLLVLLNALIPFQNLRRVVQDNERVTRSYDSLVALRQVLSTMQDAETGQRGYIIAGEEKYLEPYNSATSRIEGQLQHLQQVSAASSTRFGAQSQLRLKKQIQARLETLRLGVELRRNSGFAAAQDWALSGRGKAQMDAIRFTLAQMETQQRRGLQLSDAQAQLGARNALLSCAFTSLISLVLLALIYAVVRRDAANQRHAEEELRAGHERFRAIVAASTQIVWTTSAAGEFVVEQPLWQEFTGQNFEEAKGFGWLAKIHPDDRERASEVWKRALESKTMYDTEYRLLHCDGNYRVTSARGVPVLDSGGKVREWVGSNTDVTEKREAEIELRWSEARKAAILETALDCIIAIDEESLITEWNPAAEKTFGFSRAEALGRVLSELIIPQRLREAHRNGLASYLAGGEGKVIGQRIEVPALCADGHEITVELSITRVESEGAPSFSAYLRDITARKEAETNLAAHARLASLAADVGFALNQTNTLEDILKHCTQALVTHLDAAFACVWTLNELHKVLELRASSGIYTHLDGPHSRVAVGQFKIGQIAQDRKPHLTNNVVGDELAGEQEWAIREGLVSFAGYPLLVEGHMLGVLAMFGRQPLSADVLRALTTVADAVALGIKRKRSEEELEKARRDAEEASRTKSLFLANMSHELRTPLNAILGYSEMLKDEASDLKMDEFSSDLERIHLAGKHLLALINDILDLSKIEAGKMELYVESFDVEAMIENVLATISPQISKNENTIQIEYSNLGEMRSDQTKVQQCLLNLLSNAAKFTRNGTITLAAHRERMDGIDSTGSDLGSEREWLVFSVRDSGIGMSSEQILKLFQAFTQADASTTRKFGGTGLGLALTRRFSQIMGGDVTVQSELGQGSVFTIKIPADVYETSVSETSSREAGVAGTERAEETPSNSAHPELPKTLPTAQIEYSISSADDEDIAVENEIGNLAPAAEADATLDAMPNVPITMPDEAPRHCVLVIDDDATQRDLMQRFLAKEGFETCAASGGEEGLRMARQVKPVAITLDVMMRGMDGWSVLTALKADEELHDIPVIMLTMVDDKNRGYALGAADYATKPVDRQRLMQILQKYICSETPCPLLLIEDDETTRQMMRQLLEREGWAVTEAANGLAALECLEQSRPELILLDLMMPEMDGFTFAAQMRKRPQWRDIPIVVLTSKDLDAADRLRLNGYVQKILQKSGQSREEILMQVRELLRSRVPLLTKPND